MDFLAYHWLFYQKTSIHILTLPLWIVTQRNVFLEEVCKNLKIEADIICGRIEEVDPVNCDYIVSRALAPLNDLLAYSKRHRKDNGKCLF